MSSAEAFVALGSNLGDRQARLAAGLAGLARAPGVSLLAVSRIYETAPVGPPQGAYLNGVARLATTLSPSQLLDILLEIERREGRQRRGRRNAPRTLDLDLLFYGNECVEAPGLVVPHPRLHERGFVLEPLCELAPELVHPVLGQSIATLAARVRDPTVVRLVAS